MRTCYWFFLFLFLVVCGSSLQAATVYVNSNSGSDTTGDGSLGAPYQTFHKAYTMASNNDTIDLTGTFTWTDADETGDAAQVGYNLQKSLTIQGQSADQTIIQSASAQGTADRRIFTAEGDYTVSFLNLTLRYGRVPNSSPDSERGGGLCFDYGADLVLENCYLHGCEAWLNGGGLYIYRDSDTYPPMSLTMINSTIADNWGFSGGGAYIRNLPTTITNCTFTDNLADSYGGALYTEGAGCDCTITNSTICNNVASSNGGGISMASPTVRLKNCIFANNTGAGSNEDIDFYSGAIIDNGDNIVEFTAGTFTWSGTTLTGNQASLNISSTLAANSTLNGTPTLALQSGSVAINNGSTGSNGTVAVPTLDQRGLGRVGAVDMGAYEYGAVTSSPPVATTNAASAIGISGATLNGLVNPGGASTNVTFEYGLTTAYGAIVTADQSPVTGSTDTAVSKAITGLSPNQTYHFRVVAQNASGTDYGDDVIFNTLVQPPTVVTQPVTGVGVNDVTFHGTANANGDYTTTNFEYGTTTGYGSNASGGAITGSSAVDVQRTLHILTSNTLYHYRLTATNTGGTSYGDDMTFTTLPEQATYVFPVDGAIDMPRLVTVNWRWEGNGVPTGFRVYQGGSQVGGDILWSGDVLYYQQLTQAAWGENVTWQVAPYNVTGPCPAPLSRSFTVMAEPADPNDEPAAVVYSEVQNVAVADPPAITLPPINLGNGAVQPTFDFSYGAAPNLPVLACSVMDQSEHPVLFPEFTGAAFKATYPNGLATTLVFNFGGAGTPYQLLHWMGTNWEDISSSAVFGAGTVTFTYTSASRGDEEFIVNDGSGTLPVTLSSFSATVTSDNYAQIAWATASETDLSGYNIYRNIESDIAGAWLVNDEIVTATNSATGSSYTYTDIDVDLNATYCYWLESVEMDGSSELFGPVTLTITQGGGGGETPPAPDITRLETAYPNPFNPSTTIRFNIAEGQHGTLSVFNLRGQLVRDWGDFSEGAHSVVWDGRDATGAPVGGGVYFYRLETSQETFTRKMILVK